MSGTALVTDPPDDGLGVPTVAARVAVRDAPPAPGGSSDVAASPARAGTPSRARWWALALLLLPLVVGVGLRVALAQADSVVTNDAAAYLESGRNLLEGRGLTRVSGQPELHFPPVAPVLLGGAWILTDDPVAAVGLVNVVASSLALLPLIGLARRIGGARAGVAAAWIGALAPGLTEIPFVAGGGSESVFLLLLLTTAWLVATLPDRRGASRWLLAAGAGLSAGLMYLTRPEGLVLALVVVAVAAAGPGGLRGRRSGAGGPGRPSVLGPLALVLAVMAAVAAPYVAHLHAHTGSWQLTAKSQDAGIEAWRAVAENDRPARDAVLYALDDSGLALEAETESLSALVRDDPAAFAGIVRTNTGALTSHLVDLRPAPPAGPFPRWLLLPLPLTALALWGAWPVRRDPTARIVLAVGGASTAIALGFFVQPRYLAPLTAALVTFAAVGLVRVPARWRGVAYGLAAVLLVGPVLVAVPGPRTMFHPREPVEHRIAGEWIADHAEPGDRLMTRSLLTSFHAGREAVALPVGTVAETVRFARHHGVEHLVADAFLLGSYRPGLAPLFGPGPWPGLELAHEFTVAGRLTRIFRVVDPAPDTADAPLLGFVGDG